MLPFITILGKIPSSFSCRPRGPEHRDERALVDFFIDVVTQPKENSQNNYLARFPEKSSRGNLMPERCKQCQRYEKGLKELGERRTNLWRRGELTDAAAEKLTAGEQQVTEELKKHQATYHGHSPILTPKTIAIEPSQNLKEEIRRRAHELYEERGREDGHDLDDWLRAEAEITAKNAKTAAA